MDLNISIRGDEWPTWLVRKSAQMTVCKGHRGSGAAKSWREWNACGTMTIIERPTGGHCSRLRNRNRRDVTPVEPVKDQLHSVSWYGQQSNTYITPAWYIGAHIWGTYMPGNATAGPISDDHQVLTDIHNSCRVIFNKLVITLNFYIANLKRKIYNIIPMNHIINGHLLWVRQDIIFYYQNGAW